MYGPEDSEGVESDPHHGEICLLDTGPARRRVTVGEAGQKSSGSVNPRDFLVPAGAPHPAF